MSAVDYTSLREALGRFDPEQLQRFIDLLSRPKPALETTRPPASRVLGAARKQAVIDSVVEWV